MDLRNLYKNKLCPICHKGLIFSNDYTKVNCEDVKCAFNHSVIHLFHCKNARN